MVSAVVRVWIGSLVSAGKAGLLETGYHTLGELADAVPFRNFDERLQRLFFVTGTGCRPGRRPGLLHAGTGHMHVRRPVELLFAFFGLDCLWHVIPPGAGWARARP